MSPGRHGGGIHGPTGEDGRDRPAWEPERSRGRIRGLTGGEGGLQGLIDQLDGNGLTDEVQSWVSTGRNKPIDAQRLQQALPAQAVERAQQKSGLDLGALMPIVAAALLVIIDTFTPDGKVPQGQVGTRAEGFDMGGLLEGLGEAASGGSDSPLGMLMGLLGGNKGRPVISGRRADQPRSKGVRSGVAPPGEG
jgi:uncharacterized protein YidB (DUF937 family)